MFINTAMFKRMITDAYKCGHFIVGHEGDEYLFSDGRWVIRVYKDTFPNKEKAAVIELIGEFPEQGKIIKTGKDSPGQYMIPNAAFDIGNTFTRCSYDVTVTKAVYQMSLFNARVVQYRESQECFFVNDYFISLFDQKSYTDDDNTPEGPKTLNDGPGPLYWRNATMTLAVYPVSVNEDDKEHREHLMLLSNIMLPEAKYL